MRPWRDVARPCLDPECVDERGRRHLAEPETDGDLSFWVCPACGYEFGWQRLPAPTAASDGVCAVGIPEDVRRRASAPITQTLAAQPPLLQIGRRPDAPAA